MGKKIDAERLLAAYHHGLRSPFASLWGLYSIRQQCQGEQRATVEKEIKNYFKKSDRQHRLFRDLLHDLATNYDITPKKDVASDTD